MCEYHAALRPTRAFVTGEAGLMSSPPILAFLAQLGMAMAAASESVDEIRRELRQIATAYGVADVEMVVLPNVLIIKYGERDQIIIDLALGLNRSLRLDQIGDVYTLARDAKRAAVTPADGLAQLARIWEQAPRFGALVRVIG